MSHDEMIAVIQAHKEGKKIQYQDHGDINWNDCNFDPGWDFENTNYREKPETRSGYLNIYGTTCIHDYRALADGRARDGRIACIRIEYTPGQFDE